MDMVGRIAIFHEVAARSSFADAARALGMTGPAISKQVMALEAELGVKLLHRTTRMVTLTEEGAAYYERTRHAMDELREAAEEMQDRQATPKGTLKINSSLSFGQMHLMPVLSGFAKKYPDVTMDVSFDDRMVDVIGDGYDIVVRIGVIGDSTLSVRHLGECPIFAVASPAYIKAHGAPKTPADLKNHRLIAYSNVGGSMEWRYKDADGKTGSIKQDGVFRANTAEMMLQAALDGLGIAILPIFSVATHLKAKQLVRVLPGYESHPMRQIAALMPPSRHRLRKVKLLVDWLAQACKAMPLG